ncbi:MAG: FAD binding domain-containing protein [Mesorhizobium sp.]
MPLSLRSFGTVEEASAALKAPNVRYLGGGTLAVRAANEGDLTFDTFVRVTDARLRKIEVMDGKATLGAGVTMAQIVKYPALSFLAPAARAVGGPAIRNMASVGGNLFAPAPYGDFAVALLALGARVDVGGQTVDIDRFLAARDESRDVVSAIHFELPPEGAFRFAKVARVKPKGVSVLSIGALIERDGSGAVKAARIALGCMADRPMRAKAAEKALVGSMLTEDGIAGAVAVVGEGTEPITDPVASAWYRAEVLPVHLRRLLLK